jgi:hypothetical protein
MRCLFQSIMYSKPCYKKHPHTVRIWIVCSPLRGLNDSAGASFPTVPGPALTIPACAQGHQERGQTVPTESASKVTRMAWPWAARWTEMSCTNATILPHDEWPQANVTGQCSESLPIKRAGACCSTGKKTRADLKPRCRHTLGSRPQKEVLVLLSTQ